MIGEETIAYPVRDAEGRLVATHRRIDTPGGKKVWWQLPDGKKGLNGTKLADLPLYGAQLVSGWPEDDLIIICEGEKARDALDAAGLPALGTVTGASGTPGAGALEVLRDRRVCLWPDADEPGRAHMERIAELLYDITAEVLWFEWHEAAEKGADAADHPAVQSKDPRALDRLLTDLEGAPRWQPEPVSPSPSLNGRGRRDAGRPPLRSVRFNEIPDPGPRRYLLEGLIPQGYPTLLHGDGGVAKSMLLLSFGLAVARADAETKWLGRGVGNGETVLYLDFELDAPEQQRRVNRLARGEELQRVPDSFRYMSALGYKVREAFEAALSECEEHSVKLLILDSLGPALQGDAEHARDVIGFFHEVLEPFRVAGVTVLMIDHQSRLQSGQRYQDKSAFGSVYKGNLARSVIQVEATERGEGTLTVRMRHKKHNFGELATPFETKLGFTEERVTLEVIELDAAELVDEETLNAKDRVKLALQNGPMYPMEIAETTGLALKTVKNKLTELRKAGVVVDTGGVDGQAKEVSLVSPSPIRDKDGDTSKVGKPELEEEGFV